MFIKHLLVITEQATKKFLWRRLGRSPVGGGSRALDGGTFLSPHLGSRARAGPPPGLRGPQEGREGHLFPCHCKQRTEDCLSPKGFEALPGAGTPEAQRGGDLGPHCRVRAEGAQRPPSPPLLLFVESSKRSRWRSRRVSFKQQEAREKFQVERRRCSLHPSRP